MIRQTLRTIQSATFAILLPDALNNGMPTPAGTGFFVSPNGWFVTAAHVIMNNDQVRNDLNQTWLRKESRSISVPSQVINRGVSFGHVIHNLDFALLKVDFAENANNVCLKGKNEFPFITVSTRHLKEGEPVYSFGYPLSESKSQNIGQMLIGQDILFPRVTSAIISSNIEQTSMVMTDNGPKVYVLDKALNYGNSGGPIVSTDTGKVHALCSSFQPVLIPQLHLSNKTNLISIMIPSLYGIVSSLGNT
ncbi:MAG: trypsin-like peptidase domain-containing protein [Nitrospirae bacterium]|nr:trypsin-like peptidase domain-containing protein [Nitrospirota bacterium]